MYNNRILYIPVCRVCPTTSYLSYDITVGMPYPSDLRRETYYFYIYLFFVHNVIFKLSRRIQELLTCKIVSTVMFQSLI